MAKLAKKYALDMHSADTTLQNVFAAVGQTPNSVPFNKLVLRQQAVLRPYNIMLTLSICLLVLTTLCPLYFYFHKGSAPSAFLTLGEHSATTEVISLELLPSHIMVDMEASKLVTASGETYPAVSYDYETHTITFPYCGEECNIYIAADDGSSLQLVFTPTKE